MWLSTLFIDVGANPDRPRPGRLWLGNIYNVHRRLCMAFPKEDERDKNNDKRQRDPAFLEPYSPDDFPFVHTPRNAENGFLYRIDAKPGGTVVVLVQSSRKPDWLYAFGLQERPEKPDKPIGNAGVLLAALPERWEYNPVFAVGERYRFRILMNLSKASKHCRDDNGEPKTLAKSKRMAFTWDPETNRDDAILEWFASRKIHNKALDDPGFMIDQESTRVQRVGWVHGWKPNYGGNDSDGYTMRFRSALLEGILTVTDPERFAVAVQSGVGSAKAFGFGLLSVVKQP